MLQQLQTILSYQKFCSIKVNVANSKYSKVWYAHIYCCFKVEIINRLIVYFRFRTKPLHPYFWCPVGKMTYFTSYHRRKELENSILDFDRIQNSNVHEFHAWQLTCKQKNYHLTNHGKLWISKDETITIKSKIFS